MFYLLRKPNVLVRCLAMFFACLIVFAHMSIICVAPVRSLEDITSTPSLPPAVEVDLIAKPVLFTNINYMESVDISAGKMFLNEIKRCRRLVIDAVDSGKYTEEAIGKMEQEASRLYNIMDMVEADINRVTTWEKEYYYAAKTWEFLMKHGYSKVVASGIIGNLMIEVGGRTLDLQPNLYSYDGNYYGLCQWSLKYRPDVANMPFEDQLEYLHSGIEKEFKTFGRLYKENFTFDDFISMTDPGKAALAFAKVYERCGSGSYGLREQAAKEAYEYFTLYTER